MADKKDIGRCYLTLATYDRGWVWRWTIYGTSKEGMESTLDEAKEKFKAAYDAIKEDHIQL
jgi:hypothetical protein